MKRILIAVVVSSFMLFAGCIGSFSLTQKLYSWNEKASANKFINTGILWVLAGVQVYSATIFIDGVILNVVEFWTGKNPMAFSGSETLEKTVSTNGKIYSVTMGNSKVTIGQVTGEDAGKSVTISYDKITSSFYLDDKTMGRTLLGTITGSTLRLYSPDGVVTERSLDETAGQVAISR
jgi:hypothetical protein